MATTAVGKDLAALKRMTPKELRARYAELHNEPSRSGNKQWLIRRCAWRIQSLAEGGLSERAKRRAQELARDQDLRIIPPREMKAVAPVQPAHPHHRHPHDARLPMPGQQIIRIYKGQLYMVDVLEDGFSYDGQRYHSLSAVAYAITGSHWNGFKFFNRATQPNQETP